MCMACMLCWKVSLSYWHLHSTIYYGKQQKGAKCNSNHFTIQKRTTSILHCRIWCFIINYIWHLNCSEVLLFFRSLFRARIKIGSHFLPRFVKREKTFAYAKKFNTLFFIRAWMRRFWQYEPYWYMFAENSIEFASYATFVDMCSIIIYWYALFFIHFKIY